MERLVNTSKSIHDKIVRVMTKKLKRDEFKKVIDAGSGKISASIALKYFPNSRVDAVIFPGDNRKKNPLENAIGSDRLEIMEVDICNTTFRKQYDFCLVHCSLGEALRWGNSFENMFHHIMDIKADSKVYEISGELIEVSGNRGCISLKNGLLLSVPLCCIRLTDI